MKALAVIFTHERPKVLRHCVSSFFTTTTELPERVIIVDDGSGGEVQEVLEDTKQRWGRQTNIELVRKPKSGFADSMRRALWFARCYEPQQLWLIESDYVFAHGGLDAVGDVLANTDEGRVCFGIAGYDHPDFSHVGHRENAYPAEAVAMLGSDPVNRGAMWLLRALAGKRKAYLGQFVSNSCISSYLNWRLVGRNPDAQAALDLAADPQPCEGRPLAAELAAKGCPDDGQLSNGLNAAWAKWSDANALDRSRFSCWLNIRPSVANHISGGGLHTGAPEMTSDAWSPSWTGSV